MFLLRFARRAALVLTAASSLLGVACSGAGDQPTYASLDVDVTATTAAATPAGCAAGTTRSCVIYLGQHGDLNNCLKGLDVCSGGEWTGCIDDASLAENPELVSQLSAE